MASKQTKLNKLGRLTVGEFFARFPDDDACLNHIMEVRLGIRHVCGKCGVDSTFHKLANRRAFSCAHCGDHVYPTAETIFQDTRTPLQVWFYAIYLFVTTRHGVSGKELERTLGVTYKTAWRMGRQIRQLMIKADNFDVLSGHVELDEAYIGGHRPGPLGVAALGKTMVFGMAERGGQKYAQVIPDNTKATLRSIVVNTIWFTHWRRLQARPCRAQRQGVCAHRGWREAPHQHGGVIWKLFKNWVRSTHIHVSSKYMDRYVWEFSFRSNHRQMTNATFDLLISAV